MLRRFAVQRTRLWGGGRTVSILRLLWRGRRGLASQRHDSPPHERQSLVISELRKQDIYALKRLQEARALVGLRLGPGAGQEHARCYQRIEILKLLMGGQASRKRAHSLLEDLSKGRILLSGRRALVRFPASARTQ